MLKACWDCVASDQQRRGEDHYSVHMNGGSNAPPWPIPYLQTGKMFAIPTQLKENDEIVIKGNMFDGMLDIGLRPDGNESNIVCQINVNSAMQQIALRTVLNGNATSAGEFDSTEFFYDSSYDVTFSISSSDIRIQIGVSYLQHVQLQHSISDIRYISVVGEVNEMIFRFNVTN